MAIAMTLSAQTLEWREEAADAAGKPVRGPAGAVTMFAREGAAPAPAGAARASAAQAAATRPQVLVVTSLSTPSKEYSLADLRGMAGTEGIPIRRFFERNPSDAAGVVVVTSRSGGISVFSSAEISSSSGPSLDVSGDSTRLVAAPGRGLEDVVSIERRVLEPAGPPPR